MARPARANGAWNIERSICLALAGLLGFLLTVAARPALAGIGLGIAPNYPTTVVVGNTGVPVSLSIQNTSSAPQDAGNVTLSNIKHTPSCGDASASVCVGGSIAPGVFAVSASGTGGNNSACTGSKAPFACCSGAGTGTCTACDGLTFTIAVADATSGEVLFTPNATVNLGHPGATTDTCIINFTVDVKQLPTLDAGPGPGLQTAQLARATGLHSGSGASGNASGASLTTVEAPTPTSTPTNTPTVTSTVTSTPTRTPTYTPTSVPTSTRTNTPVSAKACSPGYWKNHTGPGKWPAPYTPKEPFVKAFGVNAFPGKSLLQVLRASGGGLNALGRQIVSALLNAAKLQGYPLTTAQVISAFQTAFQSGKYSALQKQLEGYGDKCPLK